MLESLDFVDEVILFDEDTPIELIKRIKPNIITKGGDYTTETVVGNEFANVVIIPTTEDYSTTNTIKRIQYDTA
jgi:D-beta-D-heptose 7-phosphate kinase/D-beta-D-heptose 1-phosphate adenosyltransferase